jgi:uncharacterized protein
MKKDKLKSRHMIIKLIESRKKDLKNYSVKSIGVFGSFAKGSYKKNSDVDIVVSFKKTTFDNYMDLKFMLEDILGRKIDLVTEGSIKPALSYVKDEVVYAEGI